MVTASIPAPRSRTRTVLARVAQQPHGSTAHGLRARRRPHGAGVHLDLPPGAGGSSGGSAAPASTASAQYFANQAHLHPGKFFTLVGGLIEFGGGIAIAFGFLARLAGAAIFVNMMMAIITVTWDNGLNGPRGRAGTS